MLPYNNIIDKRIWMHYLLRKKNLVHTTLQTQVCCPKTIYSHAGLWNVQKSLSTWHFLIPGKQNIGRECLLRGVQEEPCSAVGFGVPCYKSGRTAGADSSFGRMLARAPTHSFQNLRFAFLGTSLDRHWFNEYILKINFAFSFLDAHQ